MGRFYANGFSWFPIISQRMRQRSNVVLRQNQRQQRGCKRLLLAMTYLRTHSSFLATYFASPFSRFLRTQSHLLVCIKPLLTIDQLYTLAKFGRLRNGASTKDGETDGGRVCVKYASWGFIRISDRDHQVPNSRSIGPAMTFATLNRRCAQPVVAGKVGAGYQPCDSAIALLTRVSSAFGSYGLRT